MKAPGESQWGDTDNGQDATAPARPRRGQAERLARASGLVKAQPRATRTSPREVSERASAGFGRRLQAQRAGVRSVAAAPVVAEDGGYPTTRWSNSKSGSGCLRRSQSGGGSGASSQAGGPRAGAIGGGRDGSPMYPRLRLGQPARAVCIGELPQTSADGWAPSVASRRTGGALVTGDARAGHLGFVVAWSLGATFRFPEGLLDRLCSGWSDRPVFTFL